MKKETIRTDVLIMGAGLTGLALRYFLKGLPLQTLLVEARQRPGGRIHTLRPEGEATVEMGATWLGAKHTRLFSLLKSLGIEVFPQKLGGQAIYEWISTSPHQLVALPPNEEPSYRIRGGTATLIETLAGGIPAEELFLGEPVEKIISTGSGLQVFTPGQCFEARAVVSTLPPNLLLQTVTVVPALPENLAGIMGQTHTWMGESIKVGLTFQKPFWRSENSSGTVFSNVGPVSELYDHSSFPDDIFALKGFFNGAYASLTQGERRGMVLAQLKKYYGKEVENYLHYYETVWAGEPFTYAPYATHVMPHQNNGHPVFRKPLLDGRLFIAGSETAEAYPGYMEGAVRSAEFIADQLSKKQ